MASWKFWYLLVNFVVRFCCCCTCDCYCIARVAFQSTGCRSASKRKRERGRDKKNNETLEGEYSPRRGWAGKTNTQNTTTNTRALLAHTHTHTQMYVCVCLWPYVCVCGLSRKRIFFTHMCQAFNRSKQERWRRQQVWEKDGLKNSWFGPFSFCFLIFFFILFYFIFIFFKQPIVVVCFAFIVFVLVLEAAAAAEATAAAPEAAQQQQEISLSSSPSSVVWSIVFFTHTRRAAHKCDCILLCVYVYVRELCACLPLYMSVCVCCPVSGGRISAQITCLSLSPPCALVWVSELV